MGLLGLFGESGHDMKSTEMLRKLSLKYSHLQPLWLENEGPDFKTWPAFSCL